MAKIKAVFPFNFFPDEIIIDETKVSVYHRIFFFSKQIVSVDYKDILNVILDHSLFFATLELVGRFFAEQPISVKYLKKKDAILARRVIQGMIIAKKEGIDVSAINIGQLLDKVERVGQTR